MPFFTHGDTKNKLILLYILSKADAPLTHDQLYRIVDRTDSMTFFAFETILPELETDGFVASFVRPYGDCYGLTASGQESLALFSDSIPITLRDSIDRTVSDAKGSFLREKQTTSRLSGNERVGYTLELLVLSGEETVFCFTIWCGTGCSVGRKSFQGGKNGSFQTERTTTIGGYDYGGTAFGFGRCRKRKNARPDASDRVSD